MIYLLMCCGTDFYIWKGLFALVFDLRGSMCKGLLGHWGISVFSFHFSFSFKFFALQDPHMTALICSNYLITLVLLNDAQACA